MVKLNKCYLLYIFILFPFFISFTPYMIFEERFSSIILMYKLFCVAVLAYLIIKTGGISLVSALALGYYLIYAFSSLINDTSIIAVIKEFTMSMSYIWICEISVRERDMLFEPFIKVSSYLMGIMFGINAFFLAVFPAGLYASKHMDAIHYGVDLAKTRYTLLGLDNSVTPILIFAIIIWCLHFYMFKPSRIYISYIVAIVIANSVLLKSATMKVAVVLVLALILIQRRRLIISAFSCFIVPLILDVALVLFNAQYLFSFLIVDILNKDITLSNRTAIWDITKKYVSSSPWWGHGIGMFDFIYNDRNAHNLLLQILSQAGFLGVVLLVILCLYMIKVCTSNSFAFRILVSGVFTFLICSICEVYNIYWLFFYVMMMFYMPQIEEYYISRRDMREDDK